VDQELYLTTVGLKYDISQKTFAELNLRQALISGDAIFRNQPDVKLTTVNEWAVEGWFDYRLSEKLILGVGPTIGWRDIHDHADFDPVRSPNNSDSPNQTFEQGLVKATYLMSEKVELDGAAGLQFSQFQGGDDEGPNFIVELGGTWKALENTQLSFSGYRRDQVSVSTVSENYFVTGFRVAVQQRFRDKYYFTLAAGYENYDFYGTTNGTESNRNDDYFWLSPVLAFQADDHTTVGAFYQFRDRESDLAGFDFVNHQVGLFAKYAF